MSRSGMVPVFLAVFVLAVSSYMGSPEEPVGLDVRMGSLPAGTGYPARIVLDAKAQNLSVTVENSGYRKAAP